MLVDQVLLVRDTGCIAGVAHDGVEDLLVMWDDVRMYLVVN